MKGSVGPTFFIERSSEMTQFKVLKGNEPTIEPKWYNAVQKL